MESIVRKLINFVRGFSLTVEPLILFRSVVLFVLFLFIFGGVAQARSVGIWYSTIYTKEKNYDWSKGFGVGSSAKFSADVSGDSKADAITFDVSSGDWWVALSDGSKFATPTRWAQGFGVGSSKQFVGNVTSDTKADILTFDINTGDWWVKESNGTGFNTATRWIQGHGTGSQNQLLGDSSGDGKQDATVYFDTSGAQGYWYVATSNGTTFNGYSNWRTGHGHGSQNQFLSDSTGDGKADATVFFNSNGNWYLASSSGTAFNNYSLWASGHGAGSQAQLLDEVSGDSKTDAVVYFKDANTDFGPGASWYRATSSGSAFNSYTQWKSIHGNNGTRTKLKPANNLLIANVDGSGTNETIAYHEQFTNNAGAGQWKVLFEYQTQAQQNYWDAFEIEYVPIGGKYDSGDTAVIDAHLDEIKDAGIDFIVIDLTNGVSTHPSIFDRAKAVCARAVAKDVKYVIAGGKTQYTGDTQDVEVEAQEVLDEFVNDSTCGSAYYKINNVPLLGMHFNSYAQKQDWLNDTHTASDNFVVKYVLGEVPVAPENAPSASGQGCGAFTNPTPPDFANYIGWGLPYGSHIGSFSVVEPGINNHRDLVVKRTQNSTEGGFYTTCGWDRVLANKTSIDTLIINSYNEYAEETAVAPTDTSQLNSIPPVSEPWSSSSFYWDLTKDNIAEFKQ